MLINLERAQILMGQHGLDALVATSPENVIYASDFTSWILDTLKDVEVYVVVPRAGRPVLVLPIDGADHLAGRPAAADRLYMYGTYHIARNPAVVLQGDEARLWEIRDGASHHPSAVAALIQAIHDLGLEKGTIGLDERGLAPGRWDTLREALPATTLRPAHALFRTIRLVKTDREIERLHYAAQSVEAGIGAAFAHAAPGVTEADLEHFFRTTVAATGTSPGHFETSAGTRSGASFPASADYHIQDGDVIRADCGGRYRGYWSDTGRSMVVGEPPDRLGRYYEALQAGIEAILAVVRPGVPVSDLFEVGVHTVRERGIERYERHHVGHGIGAEMYEAPLLASDPDASERRFGVAVTHLTVGMVINVELPYYELGLGGLQLEETLVVRPTGYELLTAASRDLRAHGRQPAASAAGASATNQR